MIFNLYPSKGDVKYGSNNKYDLGFYGQYN